MSSAAEPPTTAKVVLHTTSGPVEIELWAKECPQTTRTFIQNCLNGAYCNTTFDRVVPGFLIQCASPPSALAISSFRNEYHSRLRFNRRGLVGLVNADENNLTQAKFFITLSATPELSNKNTLFGRVMGDTVYNVAKMGEAALGENERPLYPTKITSCEVLVKHFEDLEAAPVVVKKTEVVPRKKPRKAKVVISFEDEEEVPKTKKFKMRSAHELLNDKRLSKETVKVEASTMEESKIEATTSTPPETDVKNVLEFSPVDEESEESKQEKRLKALDEEYEKLKESLRNKDEGKQPGTRKVRHVDSGKKLAVYKLNQPNGKELRELQTLAMLQKFQATVSMSSTSTGTNVTKSHVASTGTKRSWLDSDNEAEAHEIDSDYDLSGEEDGNWSNWKNHQLKF